MSKADGPEGGFGIYVHWPFCRSKCPYCDFNSHVVKNVDQDHWCRALVRELRFAAEETGPKTVNSVFFGGGTPSLMPPETVGRLIEAVAALWHLEPGAEITLEANPTSVEAGRFRAFAEAGVNRVSLGIQALNNPDLRALGRLHSAAEARAAFDISRRNFDRVSFDLIYARQDQSRSAWRRELRGALAMAGDHLSLYQLTIEPDTRFGELHSRGKMPGLPDDALAADLYLDTQEICGAAGYCGYEISNHARPGAECKHNLVYWRYGDYVGVGPGAHGRLTLLEKRVETENIRAPGEWIDAVDRLGSGRRNFGAISRKTQASEYLMMALRLREGVNIERFQQLNGSILDQNVVAQLQSEGFVALNGSQLYATEAGRPLLDAILCRLLL